MANYYINNGKRFDALYREVQGEMSMLTPLSKARYISRWLAELTKAAKEDIADVKRATWITEDAKRTDIAQIRAKLQDAIADFQRQHEALKEQLMKEYFPASAPQSDQEKLAFEMTAQRAWARIKGQLDNGISIPDVLETATPVELQVLKEELPAWLNAAGKSTNPGYADKGYQRAMMEQVEMKLEAANLAAMDPMRRAKHLEGKSVVTGLSQTKLALDYLTYDLEKGSKASVIPDWEKGKTLTAELE